MGLEEVGLEEVGLEEECSLIASSLLSPLSPLSSSPSLKASEHLCSCCYRLTLGCSCSLRLALAQRKGELLDRRLSHSLGRAAGSVSIKVLFSSLMLLWCRRVSLCVFSRSCQSSSRCWNSFEAGETGSKERLLQEAREAQTSNMRLLCLM